MLTSLKNSSSYSRIKKTTVSVAALLVAFGLGFYLNDTLAKHANEHHRQNKSIPISLKSDHMKLGAFSISLSVKNLTVSKQFYEKLGFKVFGGGMEKNYLIMKNENALVGLFQGMFQGNMLTFNPGWDENAQNTADFDDVRNIQAALKKDNVPLSLEADAKTSGPASVMLTDPDGNVILLDQHR